MQINHKSDFKLFEKGELHTAPFEYEYSTSFGKSYKASYLDGVYTNCSLLDDGRLMIIFDNHGLSPGILRVTRRYYLTDSDYHDGICDLVSKEETGVILTAGKTDDCDVEVQVPPHYMQGEPFTFEDFTPEQLEELKRPAIEAAQKVDDSINNAVTATVNANEAANIANTNAASAQSAAEKATEAAGQATEIIGQALQAVKDATAATEQATQAAQVANDAGQSVAKLENTVNQNEQSRIDSERDRIAAEDERQQAEISRLSEEQLRVQAEQERIANESERQSAEQERASEFATLKEQAQSANASANSAAESANTAAENASQAVTEIDQKIAAKQDQLVSGENIKTVNGEDILGDGNIVINPTIMDLKWTTNVATTRKLVPNELRKKDVKIAYTDKSSVYHVEQYQSEAIDDTSWADDANWKGCRTPLTPLFENAGATFNDETGYYEMNELTDLTENDCVLMYSYYIPNAIADKYSGMWQNSNIRTNFPIPAPDSPYEWTFAYRGCQYLKVAKPSKTELLVSTFNNGIQRCYNLIKVLTVINCFNNSTNINFDLPLLEYFKINRIQKSSSLISPKINYESVRYWIDNASNTSAITITVHPTTYGYLTGTIEPTAQVGGTTEEWQQIVTDAAEKQITFATTE